MPLLSTPFHPQRTTGFFGLGRVLTKLVLLGLSALASSHTITIRYVIPAGTGDASSWANASGNLQAMITASAATDQVWVAAGLYKPTTSSDRTINFSMKNGVAIYGGFVGTEASISARPGVNPVTGNPSRMTLSGDIGTLGDDCNNLTTTTSPFASPTTTQLSACSPATDAGTNSAAGLVGITTDLAAYEYQSNPGPVAITAQPVAGSAVCTGANVTLSVSTTGIAMGYPWYKDGQVLSPAQLC